MVAIFLLLHLSVKIIFLVAIPSARMVGKIQALTTGSPCSMLYANEVFQQISQSFQVIWSQSEDTLVFFPKSHTLKAEVSRYMTDGKTGLSFLSIQDQAFLIQHFRPYIFFADFSFSLEEHLKHYNYISLLMLRCHAGLWQPFQVRGKQLVNTLPSGTLQKVELNPCYFQFIFCPEQLLLFGFTFV